MIARALFCSGFIAVTGILSATPTPQTQASFTAGADSTWDLDWSGVDGRTYFVKWSLDLVTWKYAPVIEFGTGMHSYGIATENADKFFIRLCYVDDPTAITIQQARDADFDYDGIPNYYEVEEIGSDPFNSASVGTDTDNDGMPDWWESLYGLDPNDPADANGYLVADGVTNLVKYKTGRNPLLFALADTAGILALKVHTPLE